MKYLQGVIGICWWLILLPFIVLAIPVGLLLKLTGEYSIYDYIKFFFTEAPIKIYNFIGMIDE